MCPISLPTNKDITEEHMEEITSSVMEPYGDNPLSITLTKFEDSEFTTQEKD